jgi:sortase A
MDRLTYPDIARIFGTGLIATGVGLLLFVCITVVWGDPFTAIAERSEQQHLSKQLATLVETDTSQLRNDPTLDPALTRAVAARYRKRTALGAPIGRIKIPKIKLDKVVINGARDPDLSKGPGLYRETPPPGSGQAVAIAGHRTTHGAPFLNIDKLDPGDSIIVTMAYGRFVYTVTRKEIITPNDWSIIDFGAEERTSAARKMVKTTGHCVGTCEHLVLTACHPKYSASHRLAVLAKLTSVQLSATTIQAAAA